MIVSVNKSGGVAGVFEDLASYDVAEMSEDQRAELQKLLGDVDFFGLPADVGGMHPIVDDFAYTVRIVDGDVAHRVSWDRTTNDPPLEKLRAITQLIVDSAPGAAQE